MIDQLVLRCTFNRDIDHIPGSSMYAWSRFDISKLGVILEGEILPDRSVGKLRHPWEKIHSSLSGVAFKVFHSIQSICKPEPYIEIKASPAKVMQGHNIYGSLNLEECALAIIEVLFVTYPDLVPHLDQATWEVAELHVTFFSRAPSEREAELFVRALQNISRGHTKARQGYATTSYFGQKKTRLKANRIYCKYPEVIDCINKLKRKEDANKNLLEIYEDRLINFAKGMIRWESIIKSRWLERRRIPTNLAELINIWDDKLAEDIWQETNKDILHAIGSTDMRVPSDDKILDKLKLAFGSTSKKTGKMSYTRAESVYKSYRSIRSEGYEEWRKHTSSSTRSRHLKDLAAIGLPLALLQQHKGDGLASEVVPMVRYICVDFGAQRPAWAA